MLPLDRAVTFGSSGPLFLESAPEIYYQKRPCTFLRIDFAEFAVTANSSRVNPQHNELTLMAAPFPA